MKKYQKAKVSWVESFGLAPGGGLAYKVWFKTIKTKEEDVDFVFSEKAVRVGDILIVEKRSGKWYEATAEFEEKAGKILSN